MQYGGKSDKNQLERACPTNHFFFEREDLYLSFLRRASLLRGVVLGCRRHGSNGPFNFHVHVWVNFRSLASTAIPAAFVGEWAIAKIHEKKAVEFACLVGDGLWSKATFSYELSRPHRHKAPEVGARQLARHKSI